MDDFQTYKDIRVFRFRAPLLKRSDMLQSVEFRADGPVPVFNDDGKIIGFATVSDQGKFGMANVAIDPANPERLDLETGTYRYWLDAVVELRGFFKRGVSQPTVAHVKALTMTTHTVPDQEPIDPARGGFS